MVYAHKHPSLYSQNSCPPSPSRSPNPETRQISTFTHFFTLCTVNLQILCPRSLLILLIAYQLFQVAISFTSIIIKAYHLSFLPVIPSLEHLGHRPQGKIYTPLHTDCALDPSPVSAVPHLTKTTAANSLTGMKNAVSSLCL